jgi:hypothetical protein
MLFGSTIETTVHLETSTGRRAMIVRESASDTRPISTHNLTTASKKAPLNQRQPTKRESNFSYRGDYSPTALSERGGAKEQNP